MTAEAYELPALPEPDGSASVVVGKVPVGPMMGDLTEEIPAWSRKLVEDFARAAILAERERCAAICDRLSVSEYPTDCDDCAAAIRAG
jgi:hypothetical protein